MPLVDSVTQQLHERAEPLPQESASPTAWAWHQKVTPSPFSLRGVLPPMVQDLLWDAGNSI